MIGNNSCGVHSVMGGKTVDNVDELEILTYDHPNADDLSLSEWLAHTPPKLVMAHLNIGRAAYDQIPKEKLVVTCKHE